MPSFPTPIQDIALRLVFAIMNEKRINRTYAEYIDIANRLPCLKVLLHEVNVTLKEIHKICELPLICRFKAGDQIIQYEPYPTAISYETLRAALTVSGMRIEQRRQKRGQRSATFALGLDDGHHPFILIGPVDGEIDLSRCEIELL